MEATNVASWATFQEVLTKDNYEIWKTLMKNYLQGENLWAAVEASGSVKPDEMQASGSVKPDEMQGENRWMNAKAMNEKAMKAKALYIIQQSCGPKILDKIIRCETAQEAWNKLAALYGSESKAKLDIEQGVVEDDLVEFKELYEHVEEGNWKKVESFIKNRREALFLAGSSGRTVLHVATLAGHVNIVEGLVRMGGDKLVKIQDNQGYTALALAARYTGNIEVAKCMVQGAGVREDLLAIKNESGDIPLLLAAANGHIEMSDYLYQKTPDAVLKGQDSGKRVCLLERCIKEQIYNVALGLLKDYPNLPTESLSKSDGSNGFLALKELAHTPTAFLSGCHFGPLQGFIYHIFRVHRLQDNSDENPTVIVRGDRRHTTNFLRRALTKICCAFFFPVFKFLKNFGIVRKIYEQELLHYKVLQILQHFKGSVMKFDNSELDKASVCDAMLDAAKYGIVEFINAMAEANHNLLWATDNRKRGIFSYAVLYRKLNVFQLIQTLNGRKDIVKNIKDVFGNNLLHLAGHIGHSSHLIYRRGAALQMQRELQWFKAVEEIVHPKCKEARNDDDKKPHEVFSETHEQLVKDGEQWAKQSAQSFSIVGTLITTIMFAAAFTVPGGNHQDTGVPILLNEKIFTVFVVADAISLFTSATSVLIFIWILTSRFAEKDFLNNLPWKFLLGLFFLVLSVASMVVAFGAALAIVINKYLAYKRLFIGGAILASVPVTVLVPSQQFMPPYGTPPHPYVAMYPPGGIYAHPSMPPGSYPFSPFAMHSPNGIAEASGNTPDSMEADGKPPEVKEKLPIKRSKGSLGSLNMITGKNNEHGKTPGTSANGIHSKTGESVSEGEGTSEGSDVNSQNDSQLKSGGRQDSFEDEPSQNGSSAYTPQNGGLTTPHTVVNQTMSIIPISAGGAPGAVPGPTTNLNIGMDYWGTPASSNIPALGRKVPSTAVAGGMVAVGSRDSAQSQLWLQDERELKRQRRKQSNRESGRRSRLRKQAECDELAQRAEALKEENASLRSEVNRIRSDYEQLLSENAALKERLGELPANDDHRRSDRNDQHVGNVTQQSGQTEAVPGGH